MSSIISNYQFTISNDLKTFAKSKGWTDSNLLLLNIFGDKRFRNANLLITEELLNEFADKNLDRKSVNNFLNRQLIPNKDVIYLEEINNESELVLKYINCNTLLTHNYPHNKKWYITDGKGFIDGLLLLNTDKGKQTRKLFLNATNILIEYDEYMHSSKDDQIKMLIENNNSLNTHIFDIQKHIVSIQIVYIVASEHMQKDNLFNIGGTTRTTIVRIKEKSGGRPLSDKLIPLFEIECLNHLEIEYKLKKYYGHYRETLGREVYKDISLNEWIRIIKILVNNQKYKYSLN